MARPNGLPPLAEAQGVPADHCTELAKERRFHFLEAVDGKLALYSGGRAQEDRPVVVHTYHVSDIPASQWPEVVGCPVGSWRGNVGTCHVGHGRTLTVDTTGWRPVTCEVPVPKPRDGREYTWVWRGGFTPAWGKDWFRRCGACDRYHNPDYTHCPECGKPHREGGKHGCK